MRTQAVCNVTQDSASEDGLVVSADHAAFFYYSTLDPVLVATRNTSRQWTTHGASLPSSHGTPHIHIHTYIRHTHTVRFSMMSVSCRGLGIARASPLPNCRLISQPGKWAWRRSGCSRRPCGTSTNLHTLREESAKDHIMSAETNLNYWNYVFLKSLHISRLHVTKKSSMDMWLVSLESWDPVDAKKWTYMLCINKNLHGLLTKRNV